MAIRFDAGRLGKIERTPQGGARIPAALTRVGVLNYTNADGSTRRELRPPEEVFRQDSLDTLRSATVTEGHAAWITPENYREHTRGHVAESTVRQDGALVAADLVVQEGSSLKRIDSRELSELSAGYTCDYDATPGEWNGQRYDGVQRNIRYNHVALLPAGTGRAGRECGLRLDSDSAICIDEFPAAPAVASGRAPESTTTMKIRFDGKEYDVTKPDEALALQHAADKVRQDAKDALSERDKLQAKLDQSVADLTKVRADAADTAKFQAAVTARVELESAARTVLGASYEPKGKSDREIMSAVVRADRKDFKDEGKSDDYLRSAFDGVIEKGVRVDSIGSVISTVQQLKTEPGVREDSGFTVEQIRAASHEATRNAWNQEPSKA